MAFKKNDGEPVQNVAAHEPLIIVECPRVIKAGIQASMKPAPGEKFIIICSALTALPREIKET